MNGDSDMGKRLCRRIERHIRLTGVSATAFGRLALNDSRFVMDLRRGRKVRAKTVGRVDAWLDRWERSRRRRG
jgi:hypothetical protein